MTIKNFMDLLLKKSRSDCYDDYIQFRCSRGYFYMKGFHVTGKTMYVWMGEELEKFITPRVLAGELRKYRWQQDWEVRFCDDDNNGISEFIGCHTEDNHYTFNLRQTV